MIEKLIVAVSFRALHFFLCIFLRKCTKKYAFGVSYL